MIDLSGAKIAKCRQKGRSRLLIIKEIAIVRQAYSIKFVWDRNNFCKNPVITARQRSGEGNVFSCVCPFVCSRGGDHTAC